MSDTERQKKRQAPPVPTPRICRSEAILAVGNDRGTEVTETRLIQMNQEILRYRMNLRERLEGKENERSGEQRISNNLESIKKELHDVMEKNTQWQLYNEQREEFVKDLIHKYNDLHQRFHATANSSDKASQQIESFDDHLRRVRLELEASQKEVENLKSEALSLRTNFSEEKKKLQEETDHWRAMYEQEKELSSKLSKTCEKSSKQISANKENKDRITSLQREMELYRKEFHGERRRREDLEKRFDSIQSQIIGAEVSNQKYRKHRSSSRGNTLRESHPQQQEHQDPVSPPKLKKITTKDDVKPSKERRSHPVNSTNVTTRVRRFKDSERHGYVGSSPEFNDRMNRTYHEFGHSEDSNLRCPNCRKVYGVDEHEFLLSHIDNCI